MNRRRFLRSAAALAGITVLSACGPSPHEAPPVPKRPLIGFLGTNFAADPDKVRQVTEFRAGLREERLFESDNIVIDWRWAQGGGHAWAREQTADLVRLDARVIVVSGTLWRAAREATDRMPIVTNNAEAEALIELGWAQDLAKPGGNITGLSHAGRRVQRKLPELLVEAIPRMRRLAVMSNLESSPQLEVHQRRTAQDLGLELLMLDVRTPPQVASGFVSARAWGADALCVILLVPQGLLLPHVVSLAAQNRLPTIYHSAPWVEAGGLMSYDLVRPTGYAMRRVAWYVARILEGADPGALPLELPTVPEFIVNRKALSEIGLVLPPDVVRQVTQWIH